LRHSIASMVVNIACMQFKNEQPFAGCRECRTRRPDSREQIPMMLA
jgi:hypothetical protein